MSNTFDESIIKTDKVTQDPNFVPDNEQEVLEDSDDDSEDNFNDDKSDEGNSKSKQYKVQRGRSLSLIMKGFFQPSWNEKGGKNQQLINEFTRVRAGKKTKFCRFKVEQMNFNEITPYINNTLRYPLYVCVDKLDEYLLKKQGQTTGFDKNDLPSKNFFKQYLLHIDPKDVQNSWTSFQNFRGLTKSGKDR